MVDEERIALPRIPEATADDPEDVSWALSTAEALWARGEITEGLKWLRRAAEAASDAEADARALALAKAASDITTQILPSIREAADDTSAPEPANTRTPLPERRSVPPPLPAAAKRYSNAPPPPGLSSHPPRPEASPANTDLTPFDPPVCLTPPPLSARAFAEVPSTTTSSEPWSMATAFQAVHVIVWRDSRGVYVARSGTLVPSATVDAMLVSLEPGVDLAAWFSRNSHK
jgi:hypothetical protein